MQDRAAALRYARALEKALGPEDLSRSADELDAAARAMESDRLVGDALRNPGLDPASKRALAETFARTAGFSARTAGFLKLLAEHARLGLIPQIAEDVGRIRDRRLGILQAEITTVAPLAPDLAERARKALEKSTGRTVRLSLRTDSSLIGGMIARVGSTVYDGSVRTRLAALRSYLVRG